jgi:hypothetical protein
MFGRLHTLRVGQGLSPRAEVEVPAEGMSAGDLARVLDLPVDEVEAVICNHRVYPLDHIVLPGDRVAFLPRGTPGPYRFMLGIYAAGKKTGA